MVAPSRGEAGKGRFGCVLTLLVLVFAVYVGKDVATVYWRYYRMRDEVRTQAAFASALTDSVIRDRLVVRADTLGVPLGPKEWSITRTRVPRQIVIRGEYDDSVVLHLLSYHKVFRFHFVPTTTEPL